MCNICGDAFLMLALFMTLALERCNFYSTYINNPLIRCMHMQYVERIKIQKSIGSTPQQLLTLG